MSERIYFKVGKNEKKKLLAINFAEPVKVLYLPIQNALELCKLLLIGVKEIEEKNKIQRDLDEIVKEIMH